MSFAPINFLWEVTEVYFDRRVSRSAAELAYFLILSFFPILICVNAFFGMLDLNATSMLAYFEEVIPPDTLLILEDYLSYLLQITSSNANGMLIAGVSMIVFSASAAFRSLMKIMDDIYEKKSYKGFGQVIASVVFSLLFLVLIYGSLIVVLTGNWLIKLISQQFPWLEQLLIDWNDTRYVMLFFMMLLFTSLVYRLVAPRTKPRAPAVSGALISTVAQVASTLLFSWFIGLSSRYALVYGSLASVIILMIWLYMCGNIFIIGNVFNYVWYKRRLEQKEATQ